MSSLRSLVRPMICYCIMFALFFREYSTVQYRTPNTNQIHNTPVKEFPFSSLRSTYRHSDVLFGVLKIPACLSYDITLLLIGCLVRRYVGKVTRRHEFTLHRRPAADELLKRQHRSIIPPPRSSHSFRPCRNPLSVPRYQELRRLGTELPRIH